MLAAVTALEGLLPLLPAAAALEAFVQRGVAGESAEPSVPVKLLLAPDLHPAATPQLLNRIAGLVLQV
jgi:hypothetical protein